MNKWIETKNRLPELKLCPDGSMYESDFVLAFDGIINLVRLYKYKGENGPRWTDDDSLYIALNKVTHWIPLPEEPHG